MFCKLSLFVCLTLCGFVGHTIAADCIPDPVENIEIFANKTLRWDRSTNCESPHYLVNIRSSGPVEYVYEVSGTSLNVSFLPFCGFYTFTVLPVADHIQGAESHIEATIAPPAGANITIFSISGAPIGHDSLLRWEIDPDYELCVEFYYIVVSDYINSAAFDTYTDSNSYLLQNTGACAQYVINITAVYLDTVGPLASFHYSISAANLTAPRLVELHKSSTSINTTWTLEPYVRNRCNVTSFFVDGSPNFNLTVSVDDSLERLPVQVNITNLQPSTLYLFRVSANNTAGWSASVPLAVQTDGY